MDIAERQVFAKSFPKVAPKPADGKIRGWTAFVRPHVLRFAQKERQMNMSNTQMELGFEGAQRAMTPRRRETRATRAAWWFSQMRQIVSHAIDWDTAPEPRPEQSWLGFPQHRHSA